jgi:rRNA maturation RNase YbeY
MLGNIIIKSGYSVGEINIVITDDIKLREINREFLEHDYFTDVITFNYNEMKTLNGEIYISIDRVKDNAMIYDVGSSLEMSRVIIHGILHLLGMDDKTEDEKKLMRKEEDLWLGKLKNENGI